jgi:pimeloyl-ACP methyl ester carboxylesterase
MKTLTIAALALAGALAASAANAQAPVAATNPATAPAPRNDYTDPATWLCRPGRQDACTVNLDATIIAADGTMTREVFHPDPDAPIDCFYVYPTVSNDPGGNSTMAVEAEERYVVASQFARFGARCRLYAPMYRQVTLGALRTMMMTGQPTGDRALAYNDVLDAWREYLAHDNHGRGVILVGHSQGSGLLTNLIAREIDGKPVQAQLVSAILMGTALQVPKGADVGGSFKTIPLCHSPSQVACAIAFASFRADSPPPPNARFGQPRGDTVAACVNPAALGGGSGLLKAYLPAHGLPGGSATPFPDWTTPPRPIDTNFVLAPGLLSAECVFDSHGDYLAITIHPTPGGARANQIGGDISPPGVGVMKDWGLHLLDADLTMGNLLDVVGAESKAYLQGKP